MYRAVEINGKWFAQYKTKTPSGRNVKRIRKDMFNKPLDLGTEQNAITWCRCKNIIDKN